MIFLFLLRESGEMPPGQDLVTVMCLQTGRALIRAQQQMPSPPPENGTQTFG